MSPVFAAANSVGGLHETRLSSNVYMSTMTYVHTCACTYTHTHTTYIKDQKKINWLILCYIYLTTLKADKKSCWLLFPFLIIKSIYIFFHCKMYNGKGTRSTIEIAAAVFIHFVICSLGERQFSLHHGLWDEGTPCEWEYCWLVWHFLLLISPEDKLAVSRKERELSFKEYKCVVKKL